MKPFSRIISGTMTWGAWGKQFSTAQMQALFEEALDLGITSFDHADIYGSYTTEAAFGLAFHASSIAREKVQFISKCGIQFPSELRPLPVKHYDYSAKHIQMSVENSLKNLHTDYLDVLLLHRPSPLMEARPIADTVLKLLEQGRIKHFGVSNFTPYQMQLLQKEIPLEWNQLECSLTHEKPMLDGTLDYMKVAEIGAMAWSPLGSYFKERTSKKNRLDTLLTSLCEKYACPADQLLLAWLMHHPSKIYPVVGTTSGARLKKALDAGKIKLEITDWFLLLEASMGKPLP
jgi:predicted oxidoreductase